MNANGSATFSQAHNKMDKVLEQANKIKKRRERKKYSTKDNLLQRKGKNPRFWQEMGGNRMMAAAAAENWHLSQGYRHINVLDAYKKRSTSVHDVNRSTDYVDSTSSWGGNNDSGDRWGKGRGEVTLSGDEVSDAWGSESTRFNRKRPLTTFGWKRKIKTKHNKYKMNTCTSNSEYRSNASSRHANTTQPSLHRDKRKERRKKWEKRK